MEYRDLYDEKRILTNETIRKDELPPKGRYIQTVIVFIENSKHEFLVQLTSYEKKHHYTSTGGHPKSGESSIEGIVTEVKEEIGLDVKPYELTLFKTIKNDIGFYDLYYLKKDIDINKLVLQKEEVESVSWMTRDKIEELNSKGLFSKSHYKAFCDLFHFLDGDNKEYKIHTGVYGLVKKDNEVLLIKKVGGPYDSKLDLPGGTIEYGESTVDTLIRELKEEVGINVLSYKFNGIASISFPYEYKGKEIYFNHIGIIYDILSYGGEIKKDNIIDKINDDSLGAEFYNIDEIENKLSLLAHQVLIDKNLDK